MHLHEGPGGLDVGPEFYAWAAAEGIDGGPRAMPERGGPDGEGAIVLPGEGDEYLVDPGLPATSQSIPVRIQPPADASRVELWVPGGDSPVAVATYRVKGAAP